jgi:hypothetical protein
MAPSPSATFRDRLAVRQSPDIERATDRSVTLELRPMRGGRVSAPVLVLDPPLVVSGKEIGKIKLFTATTKMRCPSFSLPAGPPREGGTCPAASTAPGAGLASSFVCYGCYATTGNYVLPSVQAIQRVRAAWVVSMLRARTLAEALSWAFYQYRLNPRALSAIAPGESRARSVPLDHGYFRIHDSGDFWREDYLHEWSEVAARFPDVRFWGPTRQWVFPKWRAIYARPRAGNLVLRPSALHLDDPAPRVPGLASGSSVGPSVDGAWDCPAYRHDEHTCASAGCRVCWERPDVPVNYKPHGGFTAEKLHQLRRNAGDRPSLESLFQSFVGNSVRRNHPQASGPATLSSAPSAPLFESYLARRGLAPSSFGVREWFRLLDQHGITEPDEQIEYLEATAEWG